MVPLVHLLLAWARQTLRLVCLKVSVHFTILSPLKLKLPEISHKEIDFEHGYAGHEKHDGDYIVSLRPDYILIGNVDITDEPRTSLIRPHVREVDIVQNKSFQQEYEQIYLPVEGGKFLNLFRRKQ